MHREFAGFPRHETKHDFKKTWFDHVFFVGFAPEERGTLGMKQNKDFKN